MEGPKIAVTAEWALADTMPQIVWDAIGEAQRLRAVAAELGAETDGGPEDVEALFEMMAGWFSAVEVNAPPDIHDPSAIR